MTNLIEKVATINGLPYKYYDSEEGENVIIFIHGMAANKEVFRYVAENFLQKYRCIIIDLPAHHGVPLAPHKSIHDFGKYLVSLIQHLKLNNVILIGFSLGGIVALETANIIKDSGKIKAVVAWSSPVLGLIGGTTIGALLGLLILNRLPEYIPDYFVKNTKLQEFLTLIGIKLQRNELKASAELSKSDRMKVCKMIDDWKFENNEIPKLFIFDPHDPIIDNDNIKLLSENCGNKDKVIIVPKGGHYGWESGWKNSLKEIESFVNAIGAEGGI